MKRIQEMIDAMQDMPELSSASEAHKRDAVNAICLISIAGSLERIAAAQEKMADYMRWDREA